jgi:hypothetical protein
MPWVMHHRDQVPARRPPVVLLERVFSAPRVRREAVARGRALLASPRWCRTDEVVDQLLESMRVDRRA